MGTFPNPQLFGAPDPGIAFGGWKLRLVPRGWVCEASGLRLGYSSIGFEEELLDPGVSLMDYAQSRIKIIAEVSEGIDPIPPSISNWPGAEEAIDMGWKLNEGDQHFMVVQILAKSAGLVGIATFATTDSEFPTASAVFRELRDHLTFVPDAPAADAR